MGSDQGTPLDDHAHDDLVDVLAQTSFAVIAAVSRVAADLDMSLTQLRVLAILRDRRLRMSALADHLGLEKSTMSGLIDRAERRGLLERLPSEQDGRAIDVRLTPAGAALTDRGAAQIRVALEPVTDRLQSRDRDRLRELLLGLLTGR
jgi:DNA-binding MarR family transcriptional regulator